MVAIVLTNFWKVISKRSTIQSVIFRWMLNSLFLRAPSHPLMKIGLSLNCQGTLIFILSGHWDVISPFCMTNNWSLIGLFSASALNWRGVMIGALINNGVDAAYAHTLRQLIVFNCEWRTRWLWWVGSTCATVYWVCSPLKLKCYLRC